MKRIILVAALLAAALTFEAAAQDRGGRGGRGGGFGGFGGRGGFPNPIMAALDADQDGELSASEIKNAAKALAKLDKNNDGKIARDEIMPDFRGRGGQGRPEGDFGGGPRGGGQGGPGDFVSRLMENDKNKDGKLSKDEIPERMQRMVERLDGNADGVLDKSELQAAARRFGGGGQRGRGPGGNQGERPQRRQRPQ